MKRKIFTLLAAFLALAAFQTNAQSNYDGTKSFILNRYAGYVTSNVVDVYPDGSNPFSMGTGSVWGPTPVDTTIVAGALTLDGGEFVYKSNAGEFGNTADYFTIDDGASGLSSQKRYTIRSSSGKVLEIDGESQWEFVQFEAIGTHVTNALDPREGGYLCPPSSAGPTTAGRPIAVKDTTGKLSVITYQAYQADRAKPANTRAGYQPIFIHAEPITARWARKSDFKAFPDFIQIKDKAGNYLTVGEHKTFKIALTALAPSNPGGADGASALLNGTVVPLFSLFVPEAGSKLVTVARGQNVFGIQGSSATNVYGDSLILSDDLTSTGRQNTQRFGIWIEEDGSLSLYPNEAWTYIYGNVAAATPMGNLAISQNSHEYAPALPQANEYFKIGFARGVHVVGPTVYALQTEYVAAGSQFSFIDATAYNEEIVPSKRYFYLQASSNRTDRNGKRMVLDVVTYSNAFGTSVEKKIVFTDRDNDYSMNDDPYYNTPYDSLNTSAYWELITIYDKDIDPTILFADRKPIGYMLQNEDGDILQYSNDGNWNLHTGVGATPAGARAYLYRTTLPGYNPSGATSGVFSNVWKLTAIRDRVEAGSQKFYMTNMAGATFRKGGQTLLPKYIRPYDDGVNPWGVTIDTVKNAFIDGRTCLYSSYESDEAGRSTYYNPTLNNATRSQIYYGTCAGITIARSTAGVGGVAQRNLGAYPTIYNLDETSATYETDLYDMNNTLGIELELVEINPNYPLGAESGMTHDSIKAGVQLWERYAVDSLFNYLYKEGSYSITEALGHGDVLKVDGDGLAYMGLPVSSGTSVDTFHIELVDSLVLAQLQGTDQSNDPYKWFYIVRDGKYMTFDVIHPNLLPDTTAYGFKFSESRKENASKFRFYQPIVADKAQEFFILETRVPQYFYTDRIVAGQYQIDVTRGTNGFRNYLKDASNDEAGMPYFGIIEKGSKTLGVVKDVRRATRWDFSPVKEVTRCPIDYIDNNFLADTRMFGAPLVAERYENKDVNGDSLAINSSSRAIEADNGSVTFTLVPAAIIKPDGLGNGHIGGGYYRPSYKVGRNIAYDTYNSATNTYSSPGFSTAIPFNFGTETRPVQLYYVRKVMGTDTTYLTTTDKNVYKASLSGQMPPSVSGDILDFRKYDPLANIGGFSNDSTLLQMFAIYGRLGLDEDRGNGECIASEKDFHYGQFIFIPAAAYEFDYETETVKSFMRNTNIGNSDADDEFRVGAYSSERAGYNNQLIVLPGNSQGIPASEYIFSYVPFAQQFACPNFVEDVERDPIVCDGRVTNFYPHDYADPSQQWKVNQLSSSNTSRDFYTYEFDVVAEQTRSQAKAPQTVLTDKYYMFLIKEDTTQYGGYDRTFTAVKRYERDANGNYVFGKFADDVIQMSVVQITNKYIGDVNKVKTDNRIYDGDSTIDYYYKFSDDELVSFDWKIIETVYTDRNVWTRDYNPAIANFLEAYVDSAKSTGYLSLRKSNVNTIAACDGVIIHEIPYYNIVYTDPATSKEYFLEMDQTGKAQFVWLTDTEKARLADYETYDTYRPGMKFCFPYKMKRYNSIEYVGEYDLNNPNHANTPENNPYYDYESVFIQSMTIYDAGGVQIVNPYLLKITGNSITLAGQPLGQLINADYTKDLGATTWFFGDNGSAEDDWVRLTGVPQETTGWLRDAGRADQSFVHASHATGVNYGVLDNINYLIGIGTDDAKLTFEFIDSTLLGKYNPKKVWYYNIKNAQGQYLTSAGYNPNIASSKPADSLIWQGEGYAYFTNKIAKDTKYQQLFGLKQVKDAPEGTHYFWVVAGVDSTKNDNKDSQFYYLAGKNNKLTFRYGGGTDKQGTEQTALPFALGQIDDSGNYTGIDGVETESFLAIGVEGAVKVYNAEGRVEVYSVDGRLLNAANANADVLTIDAPQGVIIVKNGANVTKVVIK